MTKDFLKTKHLSFLIFIEYFQHIVKQPNMYFKTRTQNIWNISPLLCKMLAERKKKSIVIGDRKEEQFRNPTPKYKQLFERKSSN